MTDQNYQIVETPIAPSGNGHGAKVMIPPPTFTVEQSESLEALRKIIGQNIGKRMTASGLLLQMLDECLPKVDTVSGDAMTGGKRWSSFLVPASTKATLDQIAANLDVPRNAVLRAAADIFIANHKEESAQDTEPITLTVSTAA